MTGSTPDTACSRVWVVATTDGESVRGYLPAWAEDDPSATDVGPERLHLQLTDIQHQAHLGGLVLPVTHAQDLAQDTGVFAVTMGCKPFGEDDEARVPVVNVQLVDDHWLTDLDPEAVTDLGHQLRSLGRRLVTRVAPTLRTARADWARHHPPWVTDHGEEGAKEG